MGVRFSLRAQMKDWNRKVIVVVGPTASGKTSLSITLSKELGGEVVSADSRQVYRGFDTTTAKVTKEEMEGVPHHLLDICDIETPYTAADFRAYGRHALEDISARGALPIIAGGTGFYIDALIYDTPLPEVPANPALREELEALSGDELNKKLCEADPRRAEQIEPNNTQRIIRALEIVEELGYVPTVEQGAPLYSALWLGILWEREQLEERIHTRIVERLDIMIDEIKSRKDKLSPEVARRLGFDFTLTLKHLAGELTREELIVQLTKEDMALAKRQMTWWKRNKDIHWLSHEQIYEESRKLAEKHLAYS